MNFGLITASSSELLAQAISLVNGLWVLLVLVIGIPLGFYIVRKIIGIMPKK